jgi:hypothetical protein
MPNTYKNTGLNLSAAVSGSALTGSYAASGSLLTCPTSSTIIIKSCQIANNSALISGSGYTVNTTVNLIKSGSTATYNLITFGAIPAYASLNVIADNLVLEQGDSIQVFLTGSNPITGIFTGSLSAVTSYLLVN